MVNRIWKHLDDNFDDPDDGFINGSKKSLDKKVPDFLPEKIDDKTYLEDLVVQSRNKSVGSGIAALMGTAAFGYLLYELGNNVNSPSYVELLLIGVSSAVAFGASKISFTFFLRYNYYKKILKRRREW